MKKINKILALGLVGASALTGGFMLSGCDITQNDDKIQNEQNQDEQKVISSIEINTSSLPSYIIKGHFSRTNITMTVTYEDASTKVVDVLESMFSETDKTKLNNVGQYNLTVNYGDKTATMYANVVDERYLLKEVVEANLDKDVTINFGEGAGYAIDYDNKIMRGTEDGWTGYTWLSGNVMYESDGDYCDKSLGSEWYKYNYEWHTVEILEILETGVDEEGNNWIVESIDKEEINYKLTIKNEDYDNTYRVYTFNDDFLLKVEYRDSETETIEFNYAPVILEVPADIKALESSATLRAEGLTIHLKSLMNKYLESDFEMNVFINSINALCVYQQYDADNQIIKEIDPLDSDAGDLAWINGEYYYNYDYEDERIYKDEISNWNRHIMVNCFTFDNAFDSNNITIDISDDGRYYELILNVEYDGQVEEYTYIFNDTEISKIDITYDGQYMGYYTYNKTNVNLEVPDTIREKESEAQ